MKDIFLSYRRYETSGYSTLIKDKLEQRRRDWRVFLDVEDIEPGSNWRQRLADRIAAADVVLVLIGREWLQLTDANGRRRLDDPDDVTRWEIEEALRQRKQVVPVLVENTPVPDAPKLPESIRALADLQAIEIRHQSLDSGIEDLVARLQGETLGEYLRQSENRRTLEKLWRWTSPVLAVAVFCLFWVGVLDLLAIDTRAVTWSFAFAETLQPGELDDDIKLLALPAEFDTAGSDARLSYAEIVRRLADAGAAAILFDLYFDTPGEHDAVLAAAMANAVAGGTQVYFGFRELAQAKPNAVPMLADSASGVGLICAGGRLGFTQTMPLAFNYREQLDQDGAVTTGVAPYPSLALLGAFGPVAVERLDATDRWIALQSDDGLYHPDFSLLHRVHGTQSGCEALHGDTWLAALFLRLSPQQVMRSPTHRIALGDLLNGALASGQWQGATVIVGHESERDTKDVAYGVGSQERYGYELFADAINTLRNGRIAQPLSLWPEFLAMLASAVLGGWLGIRLRAQKTASCVAVLLGIGLLYLGLGTLLIARADMILHYSYDLFALLLAFTLFRRRARRLLGRAD
jgi:CHASE2 domain-containing sensor protein